MTRAGRDEATVEQITGCYGNANQQGTSNLRCATMLAQTTAVFFAFVSTLISTLLLLYRSLKKKENSRDIFLAVK